MSYKRDQDANRQAEVFNLIAERSVRLGSFTLASSRKSNLYFDLRTLIFSPEVKLLLPLIDLGSPGTIHAVGGPAVGSIPLVTALALKHNLPFFAIRQQAKNHGVSGDSLIVNSQPIGTPVALLEDVTTSGKSLLQAIRAAEFDGLNVIRCITVIDRQMGARELLQSAGYQLEALFLQSEFNNLTV